MGGRLQRLDHYKASPPNAMVGSISRRELMDARRIGIVLVIFVAAGWLARGLLR